MNKEVCEALIDKLEVEGWKCDINTPDKLGFTLIEDEDHEWIRDYEKTVGTFVQFNGRQQVNLHPTKMKKEISR